MADEPHVIRGINWRETFPFTNIFRAFRVAVHPSKLVLGLLALITLYAGGRVMDAIWPARDSAVVVPVRESADGAVVTEVDQYRTAKNSEAFTAWREKSRKEVEDGYAALLQTPELGIKGSKGGPLTADEAKAAAKSGSYISDVKTALLKHRDLSGGYFTEMYEKDNTGLIDAAEYGFYGTAKAIWDTWESEIKAAEGARRTAERTADEAVRNATDATRDQAEKDRAKTITDANATLTKAKEASNKKRDDALKAAKDAYDTEMKDAKSDKKDKEKTKRDDETKKAKDEYKARKGKLYRDATESWDQVKLVKGRPLGLTFIEYQAGRVNDVVRGVRDGNWAGGIGDRPDPRGDGVIQSVVNFLTVAPGWALKHHPLYFTIWFLLFLAVWAFFGGAIARIAAVHVARDEKLSVRQALRFSTNKFLSFLFAPIIPLAIVLVVGLIVAVGGLAANIPFIGPIVVGLLFFLALAAGFVITLVLLGTIGGFNLMYPTIAVEGSDSFDAISRSFSYVFARPWRMLFYTLVAIAYGALTYLFVRIFIYLMLTVTHFFAGWWVFRNADSQQNLWTSLWPEPNLWRLPYDVNFLSLSFAQKAGAWMIAFWVYLVIALLGAFLISLYFSANTIIYYLMRREVDATEMDDVYLEQPEDEFTEPAPAAVTAAPAIAPAAPVITPAAPTAPADAPPAGGTAFVTPTAVTPLPDAPPPPADNGTPPADPAAPPSPPSSDQQNNPPA